MTQETITYGAVQTAEELDRLTLETASGLGNLSTRFQSEFERGKETREIGKVLKALRTLDLEVIIQPRGRATPSASGSPRR